MKIFNWISRWYRHEIWLDYQGNTEREREGERNYIKIILEMKIDHSSNHIWRKSIDISFMSLVESNDRSNWLFHLKKMYTRTLNFQSEYIFCIFVALIRHETSQNLTKILFYTCISSLTLSPFSLSLSSLSANLHVRLRRLFETCHIHTYIWRSILKY